VLLACLLTGILGTANSAKAQSWVGIQPGVAVNNVRLDHDQASKDRVGLQLGAHFEHALLPFLVLRPELRYVQRGFSESDWVAPSVHLGVSFGATLQYLELPLLVKAKPFPDWRVRPFLIAGPVAGLLLAATCSSSNGPARTDCSNGLSRWSFALDMGAGVEVSIGASGFLALDLRYTLGLNDIDTAPAGSMKHTGIAALLGYSYRVR
jgi:hypothetical protein